MFRRYLSLASTGSSSNRSSRALLSLGHHGLAPMGEFDTFAPPIVAEVTNSSAVVRGHWRSAAAAAAATAVAGSASGSSFVNVTTPANELRVAAPAAASVAFRHCTTGASSSSSSPRPRSSVPAGSPSTEAPLSPPPLPPTQTVSAASETGEAAKLVAAVTAVLSSKKLTVAINSGAPVAEQAQQLT